MGLFSFDTLPLTSIVTITAKWATITMQRSDYTATEAPSRCVGTN